MNKDAQTLLPASPRSYSFTKIIDLDPEEGKTLEAAKEISQRALTKGGARFGAAVLSASGDIFTSPNVSTNTHTDNCAERLALSSFIAASLNTSVKAIAIYRDTSVERDPDKGSINIGSLCPCANCRQAFAEHTLHNTKIIVGPIIHDNVEVCAITSVGSLHPLFFLSSEETLPLSFQYKPKLPEFEKKLLSKNISLITTSGRVFSAYETDVSLLRNTARMGVRLKGVIDGDPHINASFRDSIDAPEYAVVQKPVASPGGYIDALSLDALICIAQIAGVNFPLYFVEINSDETITDSFCCLVLDTLPWSKSLVDYETKALRPDIVREMNKI